MYFNMKQAQQKSCWFSYRENQLILLLSSSFLCAELEGGMLNKEQTSKVGQTQSQMPIIVNDRKREQQL